MSQTRFNSVLFAAWQLFKTFLWAGATLARPALKAVAVVSLLFLAISVISAIHHTALGYYEWYFPVWNARVAVDGKVSYGFIHRERQGGSVILTRTDLPRRISYHVFFGAGQKPRPSISKCGEWHTYRYAVVFRGDLNPPCVGAGGPPTDADPQPESLVVGPRFLEFVAQDGMRVRAGW